MSMTLANGMDVFHDDMQNDAYARDLIQGCLEEESLDTLLVTLRDIAYARGGIGWLSKETGLARTGLYRALALGARPEFVTIQKILQALNLKLQPVLICECETEETA